jgi:hypothetical protein
LAKQQQWGELADEASDIGLLLPPQGQDHHILSLLSFCSLRATNLSFWFPIPPFFWICELQFFSLPVQVPV